MRKKNHLLADAVFEGGGVKGIGLVGAVAVAEERGYHWMNLAGTSAGAVVAALLAAGYTALELKEEVMAELDYSKFKDTDFVDKIPLLGPLASIIFEKGLYEGNYIEEWISKQLLKKNVRTFGDLILEDYKDDERYRFKLRVIASDISQGRILILPQDIAEFGIKPEKLSVAAAIRMSISIPFFFEPVTTRNMMTNQKHYIVDGGLLSNFPVWLFDTEGEEPPWPTFGLKLAEPEEEYEVPHKIRGPISMISALVSTMMEAHDARAIAEEDYIRTIPIPTLGISTTEFDLSPEKSEALYQSGRKAAEKFFDNWDFPSYVNKYRHCEILPPDS